MNQETAEKILKLRRQILIHSYLYYFKDSEIIADWEYDDMGKELAKLQQEYPEEAASVEYAEAFKDFGATGCYSGFQLPYRQPSIIARAERLLEES